MMCKSLGDSTNNAVEHYYNYGHSCEMLDSNDPTVGISNSSIKIVGNALVCSFRRDNSNETPGYYDLNKNTPYVQAAHGSIKGSSINFFVYTSFTRLFVDTCM